MGFKIISKRQRGVRGSGCNVFQQVQGFLSQQRMPAFPTTQSRGFYISQIPGFPSYQNQRFQELLSITVSGFPTFYRFQGFLPIRYSRISYLLDIQDFPTYYIFQGFLTFRDSRVSNLSKIPGFPTYQRFQGWLTFRDFRVSNLPKIPGFPTCQRFLGFLPIRDSRVSYL